MDHPHSTTKAMIADLLTARGSGRLSNEDLHLWALHNYRPAAREMAPGEPAGWRAALSFLDTSAVQHRANEVAFFKECFGHGLGPPPGWRFDRYRELGIPFG